MKNIHCQVKENDDGITFLYKMKEGKMEKSYGINVAKLASLPDEVISRANELLSYFENNKNIQKEAIRDIKPKEDKNSPVIEKLKEIEPLAMSPLEALNFLINIKKEIK